MWYYNSALYTAISRKVVLQTGKAYATISKVIMGNGGFYGYLSEPQGVSAWWNETAQSRIRFFLIPCHWIALNLNQTKAKLLLPIVPIGIVAYAFTLFVGQPLSKQLYMQNTGLKVWKPETPVLHINSVAYTRIAFLN